MDTLVSGLGGKKLGEDVARSQWEGRFDLYPAKRISGGLVLTQAEFPVARFPDMLRRTSRIAKKLRMQVAVNSFLVDRNSVAVEPYFLMDEQAPLGPLTLAFVKKFGDAALALGGHPRGLGLFTAFFFRRMHKGATGIYETVKSQLDPYRKMNPGKMTEVWTRYDLPIVNARFFNSYGPGEVPGKYRNVIPNFFYWATLGQPLPITGTGEETRDFTYVGDIVNGLLASAHYDEAIGEAINLASGREVKILNLAESVNELTENEAGIVFKERRNWDKKNRLLASVDKARKILGYEPKMDLQDGLKQVHAWFEKNWDLITKSAEF